MVIWIIFKNHLLEVGLTQNHNQQGILHYTIRLIPRPTQPTMNAE